MSIFNFWRGGLMRPSKAAEPVQEHITNSARSPEWNAWMRNQKLAPEGRTIPMQRHGQPQLPSAYQQRARRRSTRSQRARRDSAAMKQVADRDAC